MEVAQDCFKLSGSVTLDDEDDDMTMADQLDEETKPRTMTMMTDHVDSDFMNVVFKDWAVLEHDMMPQ